MLHKSVLLEETLEGLRIKPTGIYVDGTFGRGGHSQAILNQLDKTGRLIALDKDIEAIAYAKTYFKAEPRLTIVQSSFADLKQVLEKEKVWGHVDGILLDLGVSSPQLDDPHRGFSFMQEGPLDMRMNQQQALTASTFVNNAPLAELTEVFQRYGEERFAARIARAIVKARAETPFQSTRELAELVKQAHPKWEKFKHPATRIFQAIRIHVNRELEELMHALKQSVDALTIGGRLVVISFHSLEDRIVKQFMRDQEIGPQLPKGLPIRSEEIKTYFKRVGKAIKPLEKEVEQNIRARSAVLRVGEKMA